MGQPVCVGTAVSPKAFGASGLTHGYSPSFFQNRSDQQCQYRWLRVLNPDLVKGPWTKEEDQKVRWGRRGSEHWAVRLQRGWRCHTLRSCKLWVILACCEQTNAAWS